MRIVNPFIFKWRGFSQKLLTNGRAVFFLASDWLQLIRCSARSVVYKQEPQAAQFNFDIFSKRS